MTSSAEDLFSFKAEDADGLSPVKDDNEERERTIKLEAGSYGSPKLKLQSFGKKEQKKKWKKSFSKHM